MDRIPTQAEARAVTKLAWELSQRISKVLDAAYPSLLAQGYSDMAAVNILTQAGAMVTADQVVRYMKIGPADAPAVVAEARATLRKHLLDAISDAVHEVCGRVGKVTVVSFDEPPRQAGQGGRR